MSQDAATITIFSNVNNPLFLSNFPPNYNILINICYQIITISTQYIFMSMIIIRRHAQILLISQYWFLRVNIHSKSLESLDHLAPWLGKHTYCRKKHTLYGTKVINNLLGTNIWQKYTLSGINFVKKTHLERDHSFLIWPSSLS